MPTLLTSKPQAEARATRPTYNQLNNGVGWLIFALSLLVFMLTLEPTASFWDCGEFIACAYKLLVPHPPGAPTFLLLGRLMSLFAFGDVTHVAVLVNTLSALSSAFTVLFLFWIITLLAKKLVLHRPGMHDDRALAPTSAQTYLILGAGAVGALAFAFSDSFWFNAEEAEVYAMSALCTAAVVWLMLKWENRAAEADSDKWLVLLAYVIGLSIGVHLLNLLAIPALGFIYYFRRTAAPTVWGGVLTLAISSVIVGSILVGIIPGLPTLAGNFEVFCVNALGLPFNSGVVLFVALLVGLIGWGFRQSFRRKSQLLNTFMLCFTFILIGYSSYLIVPIRSSYHPTIDQNAPNDVLSFISYLKREQYGSRPLLYGPHVFAQPISQVDAGPRYVRQGDQYAVAERKLDLAYRDEDNMLLPRIYSDGRGQTTAYYQQWVDIREGVKPTMGQNLSFLFRYQMGHMFWRYFLWNFVGRESDVQQAGALWPWTPSVGLPERVAESKARNNFLALPLLLGLAGLFYQARRDPKNAFMLGLLFLFTGLAIILYLNQPPIEPRERDYTFTGATFAFAIWIGLGVLALAELLQGVVKSPTARAGLVTLLGLIVPGLMAAQGWDDHDRSGRYNSVDSARNLLNSCAKDAILFTNGDNDTFPLWYAQEVEGVRPDVRVAVLSYLNTDWYIAQMKRRSYLSQPLPISLDSARYAQGTNDYLPYAENPSVGEVNLKDFISLVGQNSNLLKVNYGEGGPTLLSFPSPTFYLPVDTAAVKALGIIPQDRQKQLVSRLEFNVGKRAIEKKGLMILDVLATNNWKRPVYFATTVALPQDHFGLEPYFQLEGMAWRVLPLRDPNYSPKSNDDGFVEKPLLYRRLMHQFAYRGLDNPSLYFDETSQLFPASYRRLFVRLADAYLASGDTATARQVADKCLAVMPDRALPYDYFTPGLVPALVAGGEAARAHQLMDLLLDRTQRALAYYAAHPNPLMEREVGQHLGTAQQLYLAARQVGDAPRANRAYQLILPYLRE